MDNFRHVVNGLRWEFDFFELHLRGPPVLQFLEHGLSPDDGRVSGMEVGNPDKVADDPSLLFVRSNLAGREWD
jgi:hypothetical protein